MKTLRLERNNVKLNFAEVFFIFTIRPLMLNVKRDNNGLSPRLQSFDLNFPTRYLNFH